VRLFLFYVPLDRGYTLVGIATGAFSSCGVVGGRLEKNRLGIADQTRGRDVRDWSARAERLLLYGSLESGTRGFVTV
jgi:hypothetical protein